MKSCDDEMYKVGTVSVVRSILDAQFVSYLNVNVAGFVFRPLRTGLSK